MIDQTTPLTYLIDVDRSGDALRHGNVYGSSPNVVVLVVAGDDHGCVSSSVPHQINVAFIAWFMPVLSPSYAEEYLEFAEYGYALPRFSGIWIGSQMVRETVASAISVNLKVDQVLVESVSMQLPAGFITAGQTFQDFR